MRTVPYSAESVSELAESIRVLACCRIWLFMPCLVTATVRRRWSPTGSTQHAGRAQHPSADWPVRVKIIPQELATAASRLKTVIVGICTLPNRLPDSANGAGRQNICADWRPAGLFAPHVQRMLKLADLAPVILDALEKTASPPSTVRRWRWRTTPRSGAGV